MPEDPDREDHVRATDVVDAVLRRAAARAAKDSPGLPTLVLRGEVRAGVEHHSVVLHVADGQRFQMGAGYAHLRGRRVLVEGRPRPQLRTTTQEGIPLLVVRVEDLAAGDPA